MMMASVGRVEIFLATHGLGPPMMVMHGGLGWDHTYLRPGLDPLGDHVMVIYYDHRGNGRSSEPKDWGSVTHDTWVDDLEALRKHLELDRILLFGHSYGGALAQEYALRHPEALQGLILCDAAPAADAGGLALENAKRRGTPEQFEQVLRGFSEPLPDDAALARCMDVLLPLYFHGTVPTAARTAFGQMSYRAAACARAIFDCYPAFSTLERLHQIAVPTLVLQGKHDWITPPEIGGERLHALLPCSELVVFERSGHFPFLEEPDAFRRSVTDWLIRII